MLLYEDDQKKAFFFMDKPKICVHGQGIVNI